MSNMFNGKSQKKIPKTFNDCVKPDKVSTNLWIWAERIERWGKFIFYFLIGYAILETVSAGIEMSEAYDVDETTIILTVITSFVTNILIAFLEYCAYHAIALLLGALASIVQNTNITANLSIYNTNIKPGDKIVETISTPENTDSEPKKKIKHNNSSSDANDNYFSPCPYCGEELFYTDDITIFYCPYCNKQIKVDH